MQKLLEQHSAAGVRVFAVWEPVLFVDWQRPTTANLGRLSDPRITQFWDHDHALANQIAKEAAASHDQPNCCEGQEYPFRFGRRLPGRRKMVRPLAPSQRIRWSNLQDYS